jgi:alpha-tubulin suppressor-like RCC1 family protein
MNRTFFLLALALTAAGAGAQRPSSSSSNGMMYCFGAAANGRLGNGGQALSDRAFQTEVSSGGRTWAFLSAGAAFTCGVESGSGALYCWGDGSGGCVGYGGVIDQYTPVAAAVPVSLSSSGGFSTARLSPSPALVPSSLATSRAVQTGAWDAVQGGAADVVAPHACALDRAGGLWCWGYGPAFGVRPPLVLTPTRFLPYKPPAPTAASLLAANVTAESLGGAAGAPLNVTVRGWQSVVAGQGYTCALADISVTLSSSMRRRALQQGGEDLNNNGTNATTNATGGASSPSPSPSAAAGESLPPSATPSSSSSALPASPSSSTTPTTSPTATSTSTPSITPSPSSAPVPPLSAVPNGYCWGSRAPGSAAGSTTPVPIPGDRSWAMLAAGHDFACGIDYLSDAYCWGSNTHLVLGANWTGASSSVPLLVVSGGLKWRWISAGQFHVCAISLGDELLCWGWNSNGRLGIGIGNDVDFGFPIRTYTGPANTKYKTVSAGTSHTCAVIKSADTTDGKVDCWGEGNNFKLSFSTANIVWPTRVSNSFTVKNVTAGDGHTCAITLDDKAWCWGQSSRGTTGYDYTGTGNALGTEAPRRTEPLSRLPSTGYPLYWAAGEGAGGSPRAYSAGLTHTCAIATNGSAYCFGQRSAGLGDGYQVLLRDTYLPANGGVGRALALPPPFSQIAAGFDHTCGIAGTGTGVGGITCWGRLTSSLPVGRSYNGTLTLFHVNPTPLPTPRPIANYLGYSVRTFPGPWISVASGSGFSCGVQDGGFGFCWGRDGSFGKLGDPVALSTFLASGSDLAFDPAAFSARMWMLPVLSAPNPTPTPSASPTSSLSPTSSASPVAASAESTASPSSPSSSAVPSLSPSPASPTASATPVSGGSGGNSTAPGANSTEVSASPTSTPSVGSRRLLRRALQDTNETSISTNETSSSSSNSSSPTGDLNATVSSTPTPTPTPTSSSAAEGATPTASTTPSASAAAGEVLPSATPSPSTSSVPSSSPTPSPTPSASPSTPASGVMWASVTAGMHHACALATNSSLYCWGWGGRGQTGQGAGALGNVTTPALVSGGPALWSAVAAGHNHTCALSSSFSPAKLFCFGAGSAGQLGTGVASAPDAPSPVEATGFDGLLSSGDAWSAVTAGALHTCALSQQGVLACVGDGTEGALGIAGSRADRSRAAIVAVPSSASAAAAAGGFVGNLTWLSVSAGGYHTCAMLSVPAPTPTATATSTATSTSSATSTSTSTRTGTRTPTRSFTSTRTMTATASALASGASPTRTPTSSVTPSHTPSPSPAPVPFFQASLELGGLKATEAAAPAVRAALEATVAALMGVAPAQVRVTLVRNATSGEVVFNNSAAAGAGGRGMRRALQEEREGAGASSNAGDSSVRRRLPGVSDGAIVEVYVGAGTTGGSGSSSSAPPFPSNTTAAAILLAGYVSGAVPIPAAALAALANVTAANGGGGGGTPTLLSAVAAAASLNPADLSAAVDVSSIVTQPAYTPYVGPTPSTTPSLSATPTTYVAVTTIGDGKAANSFFIAGYAAAGIGGVLFVGALLLCVKMACCACCGCGKKKGDGDDDDDDGAAASAEHKKKKGPIIIGGGGGGAVTGRGARPPRKSDVVSTRGDGRTDHTGKVDEAEFGMVNPLQQSPQRTLPSANSFVRR